MKSNNIILDTKNRITQEYRINNVIYSVNRIFGCKKTINDILLEKLSSEKELLLN